jgi:hypothetical protein
MADLARLQERFDNEPELCNRFLSDPVGVLAENDVALSPQQAFQLQQDVLDFTRPIPASPVVNPDFPIHVHVTRPTISVGWPPNILVGGGIDISRK